MFAILQKYDFPSKSQRDIPGYHDAEVVCDTAKVRFSKQITTQMSAQSWLKVLFAILQKYDFPSKSQLPRPILVEYECCLRYCKSTIFQANHNKQPENDSQGSVVCDTAKVRFSKQITTSSQSALHPSPLFAILQKYDFPSKSQQYLKNWIWKVSCLRYCKSTIFQANHNTRAIKWKGFTVVCDTAKVRFSKQITTKLLVYAFYHCCLRYCKSTIFQANHNQMHTSLRRFSVVCDTAKVRFSKQITTILDALRPYYSCLRYCKSTIFQANHNYELLLNA